MSSRVYRGTTMTETGWLGNAHQIGKMIQVVIALWQEPCMQTWSSRTASHDKHHLRSYEEAGGPACTTRLQVCRIYGGPWMQVTRPATDKNYEVIDSTHQLYQVGKWNHDATPRIKRDTLAGGRRKQQTRKSQPATNASYRKTYEMHEGHI